MKKLVKLNRRPLCGGRKFTYVLRYKDENGERKWETLGHTDRRKAEKQRAQKEKELRMGYVESGSMRLTDFMRDSLSRTGDQIRESTRQITEAAMSDFIRAIGNIDFQSVTLVHGELYRQTCLDSDNSKATVAKKLRHLKRLFQLAVNRKQLDENPLQHIAMPRVPKKKVSTYSDEQCRQILKASQDYVAETDPNSSLRWDLFISVALATAMRRAELLNCTWRDVDFDAETIEVCGKNWCIWVQMPYESKKVLTSWKESCYIATT